MTGVQTCALPISLRNGDSPLGGGIFTNGSPMILNCVIRDNVAQFGGGIYLIDNGSGGAYISGTSFCNNTPNHTHGPWNDAGGNVFDDACGGEPCDGDVNEDGSVSVSDLLLAIDQWGGSGSADINDDGTVDVSDILIIVGNWGPC